MIIVNPEPFDPSVELSRFSQRVSDAGAMVSFTGLVRDYTGEISVNALRLDIYEPLTTEGISSAVAKAINHWELEAAHVRHRIGEMLPGDAIVFVATAAAHRRAAFEAADFLMDYLKTRAVFWKQEITPREAVWIEPRKDDYEASKRWKHIGELTDAWD